MKPDGAPVAERKASRVAARMRPDVKFMGQVLHSFNFNEKI